MRWTRRKFIASSAGVALVSHIEPAAAAPEDLDAATKARLSAVMDAIIPKEGNMPSATEAGGLGYFSALRQKEPAVAAEVLAALGTVSDSSSTVDALKSLEGENPAQFTVLRDFVYEAYYTQPRVWKLIDYRFYATDHQGPHMKPFDEHVIAKVRNKPKYYREA